MTSLASTPHPVLACAETIREALKSVADVEPIFMRTPEKAAALVALTRLQAQLGELTMRVMAAADDVAETAGARDVAAWLGQATRQDRSVTRADAALAVSLDRDHQVLAAGVRDGRVSIEQARVIAHAHEARLLQDAEATARERTKLTLRLTGDGMTRPSGLIPDAAGDRLATYLEAITNPPQARRHAD